jgi:hypothetical protein
MLEGLRKFQEDILVLKCKTVSTALESKGFKTILCPDGEVAAKAVLDLVSPGQTVGVPGSVTVRELNLINRLTEKGCQVFHHWDPNLAPEDRKERFIKANTSDWFITGTNAVTMDGALVNMDGVGNRVSAMAWGPGKIVYIAGVNKICVDVPSALERIKNEATPPNIARVGGKTPCVELGKCVECHVPDRGCRITSIIEYAPMGRECYVVLIAGKFGY